MSRAVTAPTWRARLRRWLRPPRSLSITRTGRTYLILTLGVGFGALNTGNNLLYLVLGLLLATVVVSGVLSERVLRGISVRRLGADAPFAGEPFPFRWVISRPLKGGAAFALSVSEEAEGLTGAGHLAYLPAGEERTLRGELQAARRGPIRLTAIKVTTTYPFGLFAKSRRYELDDTLVIFPRRGFACADPRDARLGPVGDSGNPRRNDGSGDLLGLRELEDGEDARRVHWVKSASAGRLLRTLREREERASYLLRVEGVVLGEALDRQCEEVAALSQRLLGQGHEVGLVTGSRNLRPSMGTGQQRRILNALAYAGYEEPEAVSAGTAHAGAGATPRTATTDATATTSAPPPEARR